MQSTISKLATKRLVSPISQAHEYLATVQSHQLFGWVTSLFGLTLMAWGIYAIVYSSTTYVNFLILLGLVATASIPATSSALARITSFTFSISSVVAIASIPSLGAEAAIVLASSAHIFIWGFKPKDSVAWKKTWTQLGFNGAMDGIAMAVAGLLYFYLLRPLAYNALILFGVWLLTVAAFVATNLLVLYIMVRLQHGPEVTISVFVRNIGWSIALGYLVHAFGGGFLAYAIGQYDSQGIVIFFLPIFLSAFAFQLYSREMQSHLDNLEEIIADRTAELEQLNIEKDAFLAVLTHDMNSPLNTIKLTLEMIQRKPTMVANRPHMVDRVLRAQKMLQQLVSDIVDLGKLEAGKSLDLKLSPLDVIKLTSNIIEEQLPRAQSKAINLQFKDSPDTLQVEGDNYHLQRVLTNLVSNAIKYTPNEGSVCVVIEEQVDRACITIQDTGYGIPEDELPHLFEPYRRVAANSDKASGTGLGLSITKAIVEAHHGEILVESAFGEGSKFTVCLPLSPAAV